MTARAMWNINNYKTKQTSLSRQNELKVILQCRSKCFCHKKVADSWFAPDVTAAMLVYRTIAKKVFWEFDSIIMQNKSNILLLFCTSTCPPHHVSATQEFPAKSTRNRYIERFSSDC